MIEELNFDDIIAPEEIPATLEEVFAEAEKSEAEEADEAEEDDDGDDEFEGFQIDLDELDEITSDVSTEDEDITSLFDSFFNE